MDEDQESPHYDASANALKTLSDKIYIHKLPSYGNKIFYALGFLALTSLMMLVATGILLAFMGSQWWLGSPWGVYVRSVHLWSVQAFIAILVLHIVVVFLTSAFKPPRRMVWVFGAIIFCLALIQTEFGYGLRGDFSSQFRAVSGADFWNGAHLGYWLNPLNYLQVYSLHVFIIPFIIFSLFICHYLLVHTYGVALPYRKDMPQRMVPANHKVMYLRGISLVAVILVLAFFFHSPYVAPVRVADVAQSNPSLVVATLLQEFDRTSDTATYFDSIDPYTFDTRQVFVVIPYEETLTGTGAFASTTDSFATMLVALMPMAKSGLYESLLDQENPSINGTYSLRFLNDMGALETKASTLNMDTAQWGMMKDETGSSAKLPPGSWWFAPLGFINSAFNLLSNPNGDRDAGEILGSVMLLFILFPYIPYLNRLPELLHLAPFIWKDRKK
jgi:ubiquinol-cytochrome c reductase cytochrome b subunit